MCTPIRVASQGEREEAHVKAACWPHAHHPDDKGVRWEGRGEASGNSTRACAGLCLESIAGGADPRRLKKQGLGSGPQSRLHSGVQ